LDAAKRLMTRYVLFGMAPYLMLGDDPKANLKLNGVSHITAVIWAYYDGVSVKQIWLIA